MLNTAKAGALRFFESDPPAWWDVVGPVLLLAGLCWWFGLHAVVTFIVTMIVGIIVYALPIYLLVFLVTGGR